MSFFNLPEYHNWLESTGNNGKGYKCKYYKVRLIFQLCCGLYIQRHDKSG